MYIFLKWINFQCQLTYFVQSHLNLLSMCFNALSVIVVSSALLTSQLEELGFSPLEYDFFVSNRVKNLAFGPSDKMAGGKNYPFSI